MSSIDHLAQEFGRLPGIGAKTSTRLVYHLLKGPKTDARRLAAALCDVADRVRSCSVCGSYSDDETCDVCRDPSRNPRVICVVEEAYDVGAIDRSGMYRGVFHVLGGRLSPLDGVGPEKLDIDGLLRRVGAEDGSGADEVILATNASVEGEATAVYVENLLRPFRLRVTRLARGIPMGSDLEYVDGTTIAEALAGRREMEQTRA